MKFKMLTCLSLMLAFTSTAVYSADLESDKEPVSTKPLTQVILKNGRTITRTDDGRISTDMFGGTIIAKKLM